MKIRILTLALIAIFAISSATAQNPERGKRETVRKGKMMRCHTQMTERMSNFFTSEQQEQIKGLRLETAKKVKPLRNELRELGARQKTLATADNADMKAINKNIEKISGVKAEIQKIMAKQQQDIRAMLSEEQLLKFDAMKDRMKKKRKDSFKDRRFRGERKG